MLVFLHRHLQQNYPLGVFGCSLFSPLLEVNASFMFDPVFLILATVSSSSLTTLPYLAQFYSFKGHRHFSLKIHNVEFDINVLIG